MKSKQREERWVSSREGNQQEQQYSVKEDYQTREWSYQSLLGYLEKFRRTGAGYRLLIESALSDCGLDPSLLDQIDTTIAEEVRSETEFFLDQRSLDWEVRYNQWEEIVKRLLEVLSAIKEQTNNQRLEKEPSFVLTETRNYLDRFLSQFALDLFSSFRREVGKFDVVSQTTRIKVGLAYVQWLRVSSETHRSRMQESLQEETRNLVIQILDQAQLAEIKWVLEELVADRSHRWVDKLNHWCLLLEHCQSIRSMTWGHLGELKNSHGQLLEQREFYFAQYQQYTDMVVEYMRKEVNSFLTTKY